MKLNRKNNKKGFTIVELVIVIGVIGILSAILIPTFANLTTQAQEAARKSDLAAVYSSYVADVADGYYGDADVEGNEASKMYGQSEVYIAKSTTEYYAFEDGKWNITAKTSPALTAANKLGGDTKDATYNGYTVYKIA